MIASYFRNFIGKKINHEQHNLLSDRANEIKKYKSRKKYFLLASILFFLFSIILGYNLNILYLFGIIGSFIFLYLSSFYREKWLKKKSIFEWNKTKKSKPKTNFEDLKEYFDFNIQDKSRIIDDETFNDLNMEEFFHKINHTYTNAGESILYYILRTPLFSEETLLKRTELISQITNNQNFREKLIYILQNNEKEHYNSLEDLIFNENLPKPSKLSYLFSFMSALGFLSIFSTFIFNQNSIPFIITIFIINGIILLLQKRKFETKIPSIVELRKLVTSSFKIASLENKSNNIELSELNNPLKSFLRKTYTIIPNVKSMLNIFYDYYNILFLVEVRAFYSTIDDINKNITNLREIYYQIGYLDACQAIAHYKIQYQKNICTPKFIKDKVALQTLDIHHPLLEHPIGNDFIIDKRIF